MNDLNDASTRTLHTLARVLDVCDQFEAAWRAGPRPAIESFLPTGPTNFRRAVLRELIAIELELRAAAGEAPEIIEYQMRFPDLTEATTGTWTPPLNGSNTPFHPDLSAAMTGQALGPYELIEAIGTGGMGAVFKARHRVTGGVVAVKVIRPDVFDADPAVRADALRRFTEEFRSQAAIRHPHAVPVYDVGESGGRPFYVMPYIEGTSLARAVRERPLPVRQAAESVADVAEAADAAHQIGVLHRDIKPHNVLLDSAGRAYLADFGLAKRLEEFRSRAAPSAPLLGTLAYASPEQVRGGEGLDRRADVYALGATLYAGLTGRPPFQAATTEETLRQVLTADPAPPRVLNPAVPRDLEMVCLKCLRKDRRDRYASAAELAADLHRFLDGKPVLARQLPVWRRAGRWVGRHPLAATVVAATVVCLGVLVGAIVWQRDRDRTARVEATVAALRQADDSRAGEFMAALARDPHTAERYLTDAWQSAGPDAPDRVRLAVALKAIAPANRSAEQARFLEGRIPEAGPHALRLIRDALADEASALRPGLWQMAADPESAPGHRFRAAAVLAGWDPNDDRWAALAEDVTRQLLAENPALVAAWVELFRPAGRHLRGRLADWFHDRTHPAEARLAAAVLAEWLTDPADLPLVVELAETADPTQFIYLWPRLRDRRAAALPALHTRLAAADQAADPQRRANLAAALLRLDPGDGAVWERLRPPDPAPGILYHVFADAFRLPRVVVLTDPTPAFLLHRLSAFGVGPDDMVGRLGAATDPQLRQALILALGEVPAADRSPRQQRDYAARLVDLLRTDPDPGVHSAADWALRAWGVDPPPTTSGSTPTDRVHWVVTPSGLTLTAFPTLVQVTTATGSSRTLAPFALAIRETSLGEYRRFQPGYRPSSRVKTRSRDSDIEAVSAVSFWEAARYCNWLSRHEGLGNADMCYEEHGHVMVPRPDFTLRLGYRLPTEAEWDYGCRGPRPIRRFFGDADELVPRYAWHNEITGFFAMPVGRLKPNAFGLFDVLGNVAEWCHRDGGPGVYGEEVLRGQGAHVMGRSIDAGHRSEVTPDWPYGPTGFRVARTLPARPPAD